MIFRAAPSRRLTPRGPLGYLGLPKMSEKSIVEGIGDVVRTYELMDRVRTRQDLVIRDDQFDYVALLDAAGYAGRRRIPLSLLDTGRFTLTEIEALAKKGCRILTSSEARPQAEAPLGLSRMPGS